MPACANISSTTQVIGKACNIQHQYHPKLVEAPQHQFVRFSPNISTHQDARNILPYLFASCRISYKMPEQAMPEHVHRSELLSAFDELDREVR